MEAKGLTPILNVSDIAATVAWFEKWGWKKLWDWGSLRHLARLALVRKLAFFFVRERREAAAAARTLPRFQEQGDEEGDKGVWMSVWVDDVDEMHKHCVAAGLEITFPAHQYAVERPRDAPEASGWACVSGGAGI